MAIVGPLAHRWFTAAVLLAAVAPAAAQDVLLEKRTEGQDADSPPGPVLIAGDTVNWTYEVTAAGGRDLFNVVVTDDQGVVVTCPSTTVLAGETMTCTASDTVVAGQYQNLGTVDAELVNGTPASDSDPSHYFGQAAPAVAIEKHTEGEDADLPPGPILPVGSAVDWTYEVTNVGSDPLTDVAVTDDQGVVVSCPGTTLAAGASMTCTAAGVVAPGQYANVGTVTATLPSEDPTVASDRSHYFGQTLLLEKATNGEDADLPPGPVLEVGDPITWTYVVTNPGPATVTGVAVTDDQGVVVSCPVTTLAAGESVACTGAGTAEPGQYANLGTATAVLPAGGEVSANDPSHYLGVTLRLEKATNGEDADLPPGPVLAVGDPVSWEYVVTNLGDDTVTGVEVTDDQGVTVTCPGTTLGPGESMTCTAAGAAEPGQYQNVGSVTATDPVLGEVAASDPSHYLGQDQVLDFGDAADPPYPTLLASNGARHLLGSGVYLGACVDSEIDGQPSAAADGDDAGAGISTFGACAVAGDDEDGVTFTTALVVGTTAAVDVVANAPCTLSAWIDWNADGDWTDAGEDLFPGGTALAAGTNSLPFAVPAGATLGATRARFRCTTDGAVTVVAEASDGEVEDYAVTIQSPPSVSATKTAALAVDQDGDGAADPGDTLVYTVTLLNSGGTATGVAFADTPDPNTALVVGSVLTTQGTVTTGNGAGDTSVAVDLGTLAGGGGTATISYQVTIDDPLPDGVSQVVNQGLVTGDDFPDAPTDDPSAPGTADPTVVAVSAPAISILEIPTASGAALVALALLLAAVGLRRLLG